MRVDDFISRRRVCEIYPFLTLSILNRMASENRGPVYAKIGRECLYKIKDIKAWVDEEFYAQEIARDKIAAAQSVNSVNQNTEIKRKPGRPRKGPPSVSKT